MTTAIEQLVEHAGGPVAVSRHMGGTPPYQEVQRWVKRGWASPHHIFRLEALLAPGQTVRSLYEDRVAARAAAAANPPASKPKRAPRRRAGSNRR